MIHKNPPAVKALSRFSPFFFYLEKRIGGAILRLSLPCSLRKNAGDLRPPASVFQIMLSVDPTAGQIFLDHQSDLECNGVIELP